MNTKQLNIDNFEKIVVLTGAGISVASGLPSYRGPAGVWDDPEKLKYALVETWQADPLGVWRQFGKMREAVCAAQPNPAHRALAELGDAHTGMLHIITQNVDGLHSAAGSQDVIELHGNLRQTRCSNDECDVRFHDETATFDELPRCERCGDILRPDIVLFGEVLPWQAERATKHAVRDCDLFIAIGTSGTVTPAANLVRSANYEGARTLLVNLEPMDPPNPYFDEEILGRAEELLPTLLSLP